MIRRFLAVVLAVLLAALARRLGEAPEPEVPALGTAAVPAARAPTPDATCEVIEESESSPEEACKAGIPERECRVRVVDSRGAPIPNAAVIPARWTAYDPPLTDRDGWVQLDARFRNPLEGLRLKPDRWASFVDFTAKSIPEGYELTVATSTAEGVFLDQKGAPIVHAQLEVRRGEAVLAYGVSDARGEFRVPLPPDTEVSIAFRGEFCPEGYWKGGLQYNDVDDATLDHVKPGDRGLLLRSVRWGREGSLRLRVLAPDGSPVSGFSLCRPSVDRCIEIWTTSRHGDVLEAGGLLERPFVPRIRVGQEEADRNGWCLPDLEPVVPDGRELEIRLVQGRSFRGVCLGPGNRRVAGATVFLGLSDGNERTTNEAGEFAFAVAADLAGPLNFGAEATVDGRKLRSEFRRVHPTDTEVTLFLTKDNEK